MISQSPPSEIETAVGARRRVSPRLALSNPALYPLLALGIGLAFAFATSGFLTSQNIRSALSIVAITGIAAVGLTAITVSGNLFSVSTGAAATAVAMCYAMLTRDGTGVEISLLLALLLALVIGLVQGGVIAAGLNPIVTTLAAGGAIGGLSRIIGGDSTLEISKSSAVWIGQATIAGVALPVYMFVAVTIVATVLMKRTQGGRRMYLAGANQHAARATGLRPAVTTTVAFVGGTLAVGLAGIVGSAQVGLVTVGAFDPLTFDTITAIVVGGAAIQGGKGSPLATAVAAVFVGLVSNVVALRGYDYGVQLAIEGLLVVAAIIGYSVLAKDSA